MPASLCPCCGQHLLITKTELVSALDRTLGGRPGYVGSQVEEGQDHDGDPIWVATVLVRRGSRHGVALRDLAFRTLRDLDAQRFPHVRIAHPTASPRNTSASTDLPASATKRLSTPTQGLLSPATDTDFP